MKDKYCFKIDKGGADSLNLLDYCFNDSTQNFLLRSGLKQGMTVLELGCGSGKMSTWIAEQIGVEGQLIAIDNNQYQVDAARKYSVEQGIDNIDYRCLDAYDLNQLDEQFDMVYCRFILHHLSRPRAVISEMYKLLKKEGIVALEEGIVNHGFAYPYNIAFGNERFDILDHHENFEGEQRDGNFGIKLYQSLYKANFRDLSLNLVAPSLVSQAEKSMLMAGFVASKESVLESGVTEQQWQDKLLELKVLIVDESAVVGFYQSAQVNGRKLEDA
jgi:ubiquinone/menaquinone biosynthesis C-methylase UbiE